MEEAYAYIIISAYGQERISILDNIIDILYEAEVQLPPIEKVIFSHFSERDGWGNLFDSERLSTIIDKPKLRL